MTAVDVDTLPAPTRLQAKAALIRPEGVAIRERDLFERERVEAMRDRVRAIWARAEGKARYGL